jgi:hypothetical protein
MAPHHLLCPPGQGVAISHQRFLLAAGGHRLPLFPPVGRGKCFDTWKNDFAQAKAWGKGTVAIANQARLAIITHLRVAILPYTRLGAPGAQDVKALAKQEKRQKAKVDDPDGTDRPDWTIPLFRYTANVSRQVLRFFKHGFLKTASPGLYERELAPMLRALL